MAGYPDPEKHSADQENKGIMTGIGNTSSASGAAAVAAAVGIDAPMPKQGGPRDAEQAAPKFSDVWQNIQAKYGARPEKPREIKKSLGKDDFLTIMVTQMKHQDPTSPFKPDQFAAQMAQFTSVEQLQNLNSSMSKMANQNQPLEKLAMTGMIGKTVTIDRERFPHTEHQNDVINFALPKDASQAKIIIASDTGEVVLEKELGALKKGDNGFTWDGKKANTLPAKSGNYMFKIEAVDGNGATIQTSMQGKVRVMGVSFEGTEPVFLVGEGSRQEKVTMRNIVRIETEGSAPSMGMAIPGAIPMPGSAGASAPAQSAASAPAEDVGGKKNFFTFEKGVGSQNLDNSRLTPELQTALSQYEQQRAAAQAQADASAAQPAAPGVDKGFANGLDDEQ